MAEVASSLAYFEGPNPFEALELHNDESIADVEVRHPHPAPLRAQRRGHSDVPLN